MERRRLLDNDGYIDCQYYLCNAYAFTAALDIDTIKEIQQIA